jgi:hypothetical protein
MFENIMESMARQGAWKSVQNLQDESGVTYGAQRREKMLEMQDISRALELGNVDKALRCVFERFPRTFVAAHTKSPFFYLP